MGFAPRLLSRAMPSARRESRQGAGAQNGRCPRLWTGRPTHRTEAAQDVPRPLTRSDAPLSGVPADCRPPGLLPSGAAACDDVG